jgi:mannose-6-phosphate isomerase-like protein (cupin superfamily)
MLRQPAPVIAAGLMCAVSVAAAMTRPVLQQGPAATTAHTVVVEQAPRDRAVVIPREKLEGYYQQMDAKRLQTLRLLEGGKFNVNIRRITNAETALVHPNTIDVWVALQGAGTLTTGGRIEGGRIGGGRAAPLKPGDVEFIPVDVPHGVSGVEGRITWLNVRWDVDWPASAPAGAGTLPPGRGVAAGTGAGDGRGRGAAPLEYAPTDHAVAIPKATTDGYLRDMEAKNLAVLRMIEGGRFNVNIRRIKQPSIENHPVTVDTWVVLEGGGTMTSGFRTEDGRIVPGTGVSQAMTVGDVAFIPAGLNHGFSAVDRVVSWLNIRWDVNW